MTLRLTLRAALLRLFSGLPTVVMRIAAAPLLPAASAAVVHARPVRLVSQRQRPRHLGGC